MNEPLEPMLDLARRALANGHAPYSRFRVGACVRAASGRLHAGCNVENASYAITQCAETTAIGTMVAAGDREIVEVVLLTEGTELCSPCGRCRQQLAEFARPDTRIHLCGPEGVRVTTTLGQLLPLAFGSDTLGRPGRRAGGTLAPEPMRPVSCSPGELIRRKRDGAILTEAEIAGLVAGIVDGSVSDGQVAAFAMAVYFRGMTREECATLTRAMTRLGTVLDWSEADLGGPVLDKHSTGGVGDKVSLILAPVVAACGGFVPMISGHGLGHTGGTLDKLRSIPGYDTAPDLIRFRAAVRATGCAIAGQTAELAPADRRLYAIRDVTATTDSIPLITASILSKKLAAGLDALVMDVKVGSGGLASSLETATALAQSLLAVAGEAELRTVALLTDMTQALGHDVGNALEVREAIDFLTGRRREARLRTVTVTLASELLVLGGLARDHVAAADAVERALASGDAAERFARMVAALGGPADLVERPDRHLSQAPVRLPVAPELAGVVTRVDARSVGLLVVRLGGGRQRAEDAIDSAVGLADVRGPGDAVSPDRPLAVVHARSTADAEAAARALREAVTVGDEPMVAVGSPVLRRIGALR
jgi:thymidine phosphorylase